MNAKLIMTLAIVLTAVVGYGIYYYITMHDVATPKYTVTKKIDKIEYRHYEPMLIAEVTVEGKRQQAINNGFRLLANYIFGNNTAQNNQASKIKMTAPVLQQASERIAMTAPVVQTPIANDQWQVQFIMPAEFSLGTIPTPNDPAVKLIEVPAHNVIAIRFSGLSNNENINKHLKSLQAYIKNNNVTTQGEPKFAFYNPPWTLPFMRRNEIWYRLK